MILSILNELASDNSRIQKESVLTKNKDNELLKKFFHLSLNPYIQFYQRKIPTYTPAQANQADSLDAVMDSLDMLSSRQVTGNAAIEYLTKLLSSLTEDDAKVLERIIDKDPNCGVAESTVNKIWENLIPEYPCLLASKQEQKLLDKLDWKEGVIVQLKSDGMRTNIIIDNDGKVSLRTRNGRLIQCGDHFDSLGEHFKGFVIDGELMCRRDGVTLDRKTGNGICNKALKGTISDKEITYLYIKAWDLIKYDSFVSKEQEDKTPYEVRFAKLQAMLLGNPSPVVELIDSKFVNSIEEARDMYASYVKRGEEGAIIKCPNHIWENKRSKGLIKMKEELECELEVIDVQEGTGKYVGKIGALVCKSRGPNPVLVSVGSGFTDAERDLDRSRYVGRIVSVKYNAIIESKDGSRSLFLPIFIEIRNDKTEADEL